MAGSEKKDIEYRILESKLDSVRGDVTEIKNVLKGSYVTQDQFVPVRTVVYGLVGIILLGVVGALLALVLRGQ